MRSEGTAAKNMLLASVLAVVCVLAALDTPAMGADPAATKTDRFAQWEEAMHEFDEQDADHPPSSGGEVFVGSSSIRLWDLKRNFEGIDPPPVNRGFGGSQIVDATHFADRLVLRHRPRTIVFYSGDNDIASGKSPAEVANDFAEFCKAIHAELPEARIVCISIKPSPSRWKFAEESQVANAIIRELCEGDKRLTFVDVWTPMLGNDGQPRRELFGEDMLHMNAAGYELWTKLVRPTLDK